MSLYHSSLPAISSLAKNDPYPVFSSLDPHTFINTSERMRYINPERGDQKQRWAISISPFGQNADSGRNLSGEKFLPSVITEQGGASTQTGIPIQITDITGRPNMIALLYGKLPVDTQYGTLLTQARTVLFAAGPTTVINDESLIDPTQRLGSITFSSEYRKRGVRFDLSGMLFGDFGLNIQTGIASICHTVTGRKDLTCDAGMVCSFTTQYEQLKTPVQNALTSQLDNIAKEIGINICSFRDTSVEEVRANLFWRHAYEMNDARDPDYPHFLFTPFAEICFSGSPGKKRDQSHLFAVPFGNDGHNALGGRAGINFDFVDTIEIGGEVGATHYFERHVCGMRMPNSEFQKTLFPFTADASVIPGYNWHFGGKVSAYHFLDNLSFFLQYLIVEHKQDSICLSVPDDAFLPACLEKTTGWKVKMIDIGVNYDLSPNMGLGFLWQTPLSQVNAYRTTTLLFSFNAAF